MTCPLAHSHRCACPSTHAFSFAVVACSALLLFTCADCPWQLLLRVPPYPPAGARGFASFCCFTHAWVCTPFCLWFWVWMHKTLLSKYFPGLNNPWERPCTHIYPRGDLAFNFFLSTRAFVTCASCLFYLHCVAGEARATSYSSKPTNKS